MNPTSERGNSTRKLRGKIFEFGYETRSPESPSVLTAQAEFLSNISETKPTAVFNLFGACYPAFIQLLEESESIIAKLCKEVQANIPEEAYILRDPKYIRETALRRFIPNWGITDRIERAAPLRTALSTWALEHNLTDDWCLDHALCALRVFYIAEEKKIVPGISPNAHWFMELGKRAWQNAANEKRLFALHGIYRSSAAFEEREAYAFDFKYDNLEFRVSGPFYKLPSEFKKEVESEFARLRGPKIRGARKHLNYRLEEYLANVAKLSTDLKLTAPPTWRKSDEHLSWLTDYQLPECKTYRQIARETSKDEKTIREGIQRSASLMSLTLRSNDADKRTGRPKGSKDTHPRRRVDHRREKLRGN